MIKKSSLAGMLIAALTTTVSAAYAEPVSVGFGQDKPPFVTEDCSDGIEVRLAKELFSRAGFEAVPHCMANKRMIHSYSTGAIDAGVTVPANVDGMFYTDVFSGFENFAITRTADNITIDSVADLGDKSTIAWNNAAEVLGDEFAAVTANNPKYEEATGQVMQVKKFLSGRVDVILIDKNIMRWLTKQAVESGELGDVDTEFTYHPIFPGTLDYYIGFSDEAKRDRANAALAEMRADGTYQKIVDEYLSF